MFNFPKCRDCNATLPIATGICPHCTQLSPAPAQQSQSDSVAAPAEVGQGQGTPTLEQFEVFLRNRREKNLALLRAPSPVFERLFEEVERCKPYVSQMKLCELALALVVEFKSEQSA